MLGLHISDFLWRPSKHPLVTLEYDGTSLAIYRLKTGSSLLFSLMDHGIWKLSLQLILSLKDFLWLKKRCLKSSTVFPK